MQETKTAIYERRSGYETGAHYSTFSFTSANGMACLRELFPDGVADEMNFVLFSTSGVHGSYSTIEAIQASLRKYGEDPAFLSDESDLAVPDDYRSPNVTVVIVQPRICCFRYGNARVAPEDIDYLKNLRATSWSAVSRIGREESC